MARHVEGNHAEVPGDRFVVQKKAELAAVSVDHHSHAVSTTTSLTRALSTPIVRIANWVSTRPSSRWASGSNRGRFAMGSVNDFEAPAPDEGRLPINLGVHLWARGRRARLVKRALQ